MMSLLVMANWLKSCQKVKKSSKSRKSLKSVKNLEKPSVWRNVYQSINLPLIRYKKLKSSENCLISSCWDQEKFSPYHLWINYWQSKANRVADALSCFFSKKLRQDGRYLSRGYSNYLLAHSQASFFSSPLLPSFLSTNCTSSLYYFNSADTLRKKTSQPKARRMLKELCITELLWY